ncbi:MAG: mevalonate kinase [Myxococcales bacterium]|jgi:mevalonate kinase|nr:mevalonate kinase [Myxococcales bacterium]
MSREPNEEHLSAELEERMDRHREEQGGGPPPTGQGNVVASAFAPGKVILLGEHAVVFGHPAIAGPLEQGVKVQLEQSERGGIQIDGCDEVSSLARAVRRCLHEFRLTDLKVSSSGDLPRSVGLGSSAAFAVALVRACAAATGLMMRPQGLLDRAFEFEREFHGTPSGVDHNVAFERKLLRFVKGQRGQQIFLPKPLQALVWVVSSRGSTREHVGSIASLAQENPERVERIFQFIRGLTDGAVEALEAGRYDEVGRAMDENHRCLQELGLSTSELDAACERLRSLGCLGAKLTGAGGGGAVVALTEDAGAVMQKLDVDPAHLFVARWAPTN